MDEGRVQGRRQLFAERADPEVPGDVANEVWRRHPEVFERRRDRVARVIPDEENLGAPHLPDRLEGSGIGRNEKRRARCSHERTLPERR